MRSLLLSALLLATACAPKGTSIIFALDENAQSLTVVMDGIPLQMIRNGDNVYAGLWRGSKAKGAAKILFKDGESIFCPIEIGDKRTQLHSYKIIERSCELAAKSI